MKMHELGTPKEKKFPPFTKLKKHIEITKTQVVSSSIIIGKNLG
jgi:hypothetical protein